MSDMAIFTINKLTVVLIRFELMTTLQTNELPNKATIVVNPYKAKTNMSLSLQIGETSELSGSKGSSVESESFN
jgi:hypothetical protein